MVHNLHRICMASASCRSCGRFKIDCLEQDTISAPPVSTRLLPNCPIEALKEHQIRGRNNWGNYSVQKFLCCSKTLMIQYHDITMIFNMLS